MRQLKNTMTHCSGIPPSISWGNSNFCTTFRLETSSKGIFSECLLYISNSFIVGFNTAGNLFNQLLNCSTLEPGEKLTALLNIEDRLVLVGTSKGRLLAFSPIIKADNVFFRESISQILCQHEIKSLLYIGNSHLGVLDASGTVIIYKLVDDLNKKRSSIKLEYISKYDKYKFTILRWTNKAFFGVHNGELTIFEFNFCESKFSNFCEHKFDSIAKVVSIEALASKKDKDCFIITVLFSNHHIELFRFYQSKAFFDEYFALSEFHFRNQLSELLGAEIVTGSEEFRYRADFVSFLNEEKVIAANFRGNIYIVDLLNQNIKEILDHPHSNAVVALQHSLNKGLFYIFGTDSRISIFNQLEDSLIKYLEVLHTNNYKPTELFALQIKIDEGSFELVSINSNSELFSITSKNINYCKKSVMKGKKETQINTHKSVARHNLICVVDNTKIPRIKDFANNITLSNMKYSMKKEDALNAASQVLSIGFANTRTLEVSSSTLVQFANRFEKESNSYSCCLDLIDNLKDIDESNINYDLVSIVSNQGILFWDWVKGKTNFVNIKKLEEIFSQEKNIKAKLLANGSHDYWLFAVSDNAFHVFYGSQISLSTAFKSEHKCQANHIFKSLLLNSDSSITFIANSISISFYLTSIKKDSDSELKDFKALEDFVKSQKFQFSTESKSFQLMNHSDPQKLSSISLVAIDVIQLNDKKNEFLIGVATQQGVVRIYNLNALSATLSLLYEIYAHSKLIVSIVFLSYTMIATSSVDLSTKIWNLKFCKEIDQSLPLIN